MHIIQKKILRFLQETKISNIGFSQLGRFIDEPHPQKMKHHLEQLEEKGFILRDKKSGLTKVIRPIHIENSKLINLPILGSASCGPADLVAEENIEGYLKMSSSILEKKKSNDFFIIKASGDSLNKAKKIKGGTIENGDYVVIDGKNRNPKNGDYVLSIIDDNANLKRFYKKGKQVVLISESSSDIPQIYIHPKDFPKYMINGKVIQDIKKQKQKDVE